MEFHCQNKLTQTANLTIVPCFKDDLANLSQILDCTESDNHLVTEDFNGAAGGTILLYPDNTFTERTLLLGLGKSNKSDLESIRRAFAATAKILRKVKTENLAIQWFNHENLSDSDTAQAIVEGILLGLYEYNFYRTELKKAPYLSPASVTFFGNDLSEEDVLAGGKIGKISADATYTARDLVNLAPGEKTSVDLANAARHIAEENGIRADIWDKAAIEAEGMGGLLAVNRGSIVEPTFSILEWQPENAQNKKPIVLVGKGVVFDTGGLSLKPTKASMDRMKSDMSGAAVVLGTMQAVAQLNLPLHIIALIPSTDNRPGQHAYVPGEVVTMHSGLTVEVLNTDAEGRMILADALSYAKRYEPEFVMDFATLTGAVVTALGSYASAILTNEDEGSESRLAMLEAAGRRSGDRVFPLPMMEEYATLLKSTVADMKNIGGREAGTVTAAKFLERFTDYPWVHVDIAGTSFFQAARNYRPVGGTGFGVRLMIEMLRQYKSA